jgi:hypothetical protein
LAGKRELIPAVRKNVSIDWTVRESARARIRIAVKRLLRRYGYPPDLQEAATQTVLAQAELLAGEWAGEPTKECLSGQQNQVANVSHSATPPACETFQQRGAANALL